MRSGSLRTCAPDRLQTFAAHQFFGSAPLEWRAVTDSRAAIALDAATDFLGEADADAPPAAPQAGSSDGLEGFSALGHDVFQEVLFSAAGGVAATVMYGAPARPVS